MSEMALTPWIITAITVTAVHYLDRWENKYIKSVFDWVPAILLAYLIPALISEVSGRSFATHGIHQYSMQYFIPMAIVAVMSTLSLKQLRSIGWKPIFIFISGSFWIALFPVAIVLILSDSQLVKEILFAQEYWKGLPPIVGSWIGGSTSQLVLKELVNCPENIFLIILVLDNILVNIWTILMFQGIKKSDLLNSAMGIGNLSMPDSLETRAERPLNSLYCIILLVSSVLLVNALIGSFIMKIVILSGIGLILSNFIKGWNFNFVLKLGSIMIIVVMAVLGLKLSFGQIEIEFNLMLFLVIWLVSHFLVMLLVAKLLNVNVAWVHISSMANVGGIATAPAVTSAYEKKWMPHAIVLAILSMTTGTFWGMLTIFLLETLIGL